MENLGLNRFFKIRLLKFIKKLLNINLLYKKVIVASSDIIICFLAFFISVYMRIGKLDQFHSNYFIVSFVSMVIMFYVFYKFKMYDVIFRHYDHRALKLTIKAVFIYAIIYCFTLFYFNIENVPRTIGVIQPLVLLVLIHISRSTLSIIVNFILVGNRKEFKFKNIIIYGSGKAGQGLANNFYVDPLIRIVGFFDDNKVKQGRYISGYKIINKTQLEKLIEDKKIDEVWLAVPSMSSSRKIEVLKYLEKINVTIKTLPNIEKIKAGKASIKDLRSLNLNELLGRVEHKKNIKFNFKNQIIFIFGAGGTIGTNLCKKIIKSNPKKILLFDKNEFNLYSIHSELEFVISNDKTIKTQIIPILGSISDKILLNKIFSKWKCDVLYNAAAYKHVPLVESNVVVGLNNNVFGTLNLIEVAEKYSVKKFILISTDKAVNPTNIMGVSKRISELILSAQALKSQNTIYATVRFGNVLGSSGSVIPKFKKQIDNGGPITLTHKEITRFFMSLEEATDLVIEAGNIAKGGETFLLDMGKPVKIYDLILKILKIEALTLKDDRNLKGDIEVKITGLRPGEKLFEELLISNKKNITQNPKIFKGFEPIIKKEDLMPILKKLKLSMDQNDDEMIVLYLKKLVPEYNNIKKYPNIF